MDLDLIQKLVNERKMKWSTHVAARMHERNIKRMDVLNCLLHGEIIEEYPDDFPTPSQSKEKLPGIWDNVEK